MQEVEDMAQQSGAYCNIYHYTIRHTLLLAKQTICSPTCSLATVAP